MDTVNPGRRRILRAAGAAGALFLPVPHASTWAQSSEVPNLLKVPKIALAIGNSRYKNGPLRNPANDAKAIGGELRSFGFEVTLLVDADKAQMAAAVRAYVAELTKRKCVGLFYYAGHGVQLAWRNYMLPVDAAIGAASDIAGQGVEVNGLLEGLAGAANPMNIIILDACRDNPFGDLNGIDQKGLSQMDAPQSTLLAYATSPGNVAIDGDDANGLYTESLLKEMKVSEAKIEDVFKRVRLSVRRRSNGLQIPWESTSLEEDFWFLPPKNLAEPSDAEREKQFDEELAHWERTKGATAPEPLEAYLRRFPSGNFSELAQLQLESALAKQGERRIRHVSQDGNPYTRGWAEANTGWKVGDRYEYQRHDRLLGGDLGHVRNVIVEITEHEIRYGSGLVTDLLGNVLKQPGGRVYSHNQLEPQEYRVGKQWSTQFRITRPDGTSGLNEMQLRIATRERVTVPAGTFDAFRIEGRGVFEEEKGTVEVSTITKWVAPEQVRREIAMEEIRERTRGGGGGGERGGKRGGRRGARRGGLKVVRSLRFELVNYRQS
jgi:uncharacterized caspase-like protein